MNWILVTGGVSSGIGKGCLGATLGRMLARAGLTVEYRKIEPCLQGGIEDMPNTAFGEIVRTPEGVVFDGDVARAAFYIPGYVPDHVSDLSMGRAMMTLLETAFLEKVPSPRLIGLSDVLREHIGRSASLGLIEVGGTAGEIEHQLLLRMLLRALGRPALHLHLTYLSIAPDGRVSSKPAQLSLDSLPLPADLVLVRTANGGSSEQALKTLIEYAGVRCRVIAMEEDADWPERGCYNTLQQPICRELIEACLHTGSSEDPLFRPPPRGGRRLVGIVDDHAGPDGYSSLLHRLRAWSSGRIEVRFVSGKELPSTLHGLIRIGERRPVALPSSGAFPVLTIVPAEQGLDGRNPAFRPDWLGTADAPSGPVLELVEQVLDQELEPPGAPAGLAYRDSDFAAVYLRHSRGGRLRDHEALERSIWQALPGPEQLKNARILDIGCGDGRWAARLLGAGAREVVGVEASPAMADAAAERQLDRFRLIRCGIEEVKLEGMFDAMLASMSLDHVEAIDEVLLKLSQHLLPHGRLLVSTEHPLRTAARDGRRWHDEGPDGRTARVRDYGAAGWRTYRWFGHATPVAVFHRPIEAWIDAARNAGLSLLAAREPVAPDVRDAGNPRFWLLVLERPGPTRPLVTLDGASGSGKSTLGRLLAQELGWAHFDSGRLMRVFAWRRLREHTQRPVTSELHDGEVKFLIDGQEPSELDGREIESACRQVASEPDACEQMDALIETWSRTPCVLTGRAMSRRYPDALVRFWLETPLELRADRGGIDEVILHSRDEADRFRQRLTDPDIAAISLDGTLELSALLRRATHIIRTRLPTGVPSLTPSAD